MRIAIERRRPRPLPPARLVEVVTSRTNAATITPAENLLAAISMAEPFSLEIVGTNQARWFLVRAGSPSMRAHLEDQVGAAYPQAGLRSLDLDRQPGLDPAQLAPGEQAAACCLVLRQPPYLPLRTFLDTDVNAATASQADPVLGILAAMGQLPDGWRALSQLVLRPAPDDWCKGYLRLAVEHPLAHERAAGRPDTSLTSVFVMAGLCAFGTLALHAYQWYLEGQWLPLGIAAGAALIGVPAILWLVHRLSRHPVHDVRLVQEKVSRVAYVSQLRLAVFAPAGVPPAAVQARVDGLAAAYRQFNLAAGNGFVARSINLNGRDLRELAPIPSGRATAVLNTRELAGLWHLPQAQADLPFLERTTARQRLPLPVTVARGCPIGVSAHQGRRVHVAIPDEIMRRHLLLVAKTRRGKSSLLLRLARYLMETDAGAARPGLVLVDPHQDLARAALGAVPASRRRDVVYLDVGERERPFGLNLLDVGLFRDRDKAVSNALAIFRREFGEFWGPRMEDAFRYALLTLYQANQAICAADPSGRERQHTILQVPAVLVDNAFRRSLLRLVTDPVVKAWWSGYFDRLDRRLQVEISNPVQTKVQRFAGSYAARAIIGQPRSTIDPGAWVQSGAVIIINTARGTVGEDTAALVGATLVNVVALAMGEQAALDAQQRCPMTLLVDEFHTMPGADYEGILSELAKYGANLVLATQSLARLEALNHDGERPLRATVFANLDGLFAFHTSAEDATYLVKELGEGVDEQDLVALGEHQCYVRLSAGQERLPVFSVHLHPPPESDRALGDQLAAASAGLYGRHHAAVEADLQSALAQIEQIHQRLPDQGQPGESGAGVGRDGASGDGPAKNAGKPKSPRSEHRPRSRRNPQPKQGELFAQPGREIPIDEGTSDGLEPEPDAPGELMDGEPRV